MKPYNFCIIGSGIAGMSVALRLADYGSVCVITKGPLISGSTPLAQGGISAVTNFQEDSYQSHIDDTMQAGGNVNNEKTVKILVESGKEIIDDLHAWGVRFAPKQHLEGGHSFPRIWNSQDRTGNHIAHVLAKNVLENKKITVIEHSAAFYLDAQKNVCTAQNLQKNTSFQVHYSALVIATGGYSSLFLASTSPPGNTGDAIAMAINAGISVKEMSKIQFHPTVLKKERFPRLLLTEAIRGAGGNIVNEKGEKIINPLLPRDIVAKAVWKAEMNGENIFLDGRHIHHFAEKFPFITSVLSDEFSINPQTELLPITFGAHYCMGGIATNEWGQTNVENVYAVGECANNGVHGNNRLASNSLLEGLVFAKQAVKKIVESDVSSLQKKEKIQFPPFIASDKQKEKVFFEKIKQTLSRYASIERNAENCRKASAIFAEMQAVSTREKNALCIAKAIVKDMET